MKQRNKRGLLGALGATLAAGALALTGTVAAHADPTVDPDKKGSITLTKLLGDSGSGESAGTGAENTTLTEKPVKNVEYQLCGAAEYGAGQSTGTVGETIDLTTNEGWAFAQTLSNPDYVWKDISGGGAAGLYADDTASDPIAVFPSCVTGTTDEDGVIPFGTDGSGDSTLPLGVYMLRETSVTGATIPGTPDPEPVDLVLNPAHYVVTVPMTNPNQTEWMYDIFVYPKDGSVEIDKEITDGENLLGAESSIEWTVTVPPVNLPLDQEDPSVTITDTFPLVSTGLEYDSGNPAVTYTVKLGTQELVSELDYTPTWGGTDGNVLAIDLIFGADASGKVTLQNLKDADITIKIEGSITNTVDTLGGYVLENQAAVDVNGATSDCEVESRYGAVSFMKKNTDEAGLAGAVFSVFPQQTGGTAVKAGVTSADGNNSTTLGEVSLPGLRASNYAKGVEQYPGKVQADGSGGYECVADSTSKYQVYWLEETKAPEGYELLAQRIPFVVEVDSSGGTALKQVEFPYVYETDSTWGAEDVDAGCDFAASSLTDLTEIKNVQHDAGFKLPLTGGWGTIWLMVAGGVLLALVLVVARRRRAEDA